MALKKVALRRLEDGIPNQALREIKALQEIEDNQYVRMLSVPLNIYHICKKYPERNYHSCLCLLQLNVNSCLK